MERIRQIKMSDEDRYVQAICKLGHYYTRRYYQFLLQDKNRSFCTCGSPEVWTNVVDDSGMRAHGAIPEKELAKFKLSEQIDCVCSCCGHKHIKQSAIYRIPAPEETRAMRCYWDNKTKSYIKLGEEDEG